MSAQEWERRVLADLALSGPQDDPEPGPEGVDWWSSPGPVAEKLTRLWPEREPRDEVPG